MAKVKRPAEERFRLKVDRRGPDECWPWLGSCDWNGRGDFYIDGRRQKAPRIAWAFEHGRPFPPELDACHSCDNPSCVNPKHIWLGTAKDNALDAMRKGRLRLPQDRPDHQPWQNALTHCKYGHPFTPENTMLLKPPQKRRCRTCKRLRVRKRALLSPREGTPLKDHEDQDLGLPGSAATKGL